MTYLEIIQLVKNKAAADLTSEELDALRAKLKESPQLYSVLGGRDWVEDYLASAASAATETLSDVYHEERPQPGPETVQAAPVRGSRPWWAAALAVMVMGSIAAWFVYPFQRTADTPPVARPTVDAQSTANGSATTNKSNLPVRRSDADQSPSPENKPWHNWTIEKEDGAKAVSSWHWDFADPGNPRPMAWLSTGGNRVSLIAEQDIPAGEHWLLARISQIEQASKPGAVEVRVDGQPVARFELPEATSDGRYAVPLAPYQDRRARIEVVFTPGSSDDRVDWQSLSIVAPEKLTDAGGTITIVPLLADENPVAPPADAKAITYRPTPYPVWDEEGMPATVDANAGGSVERVRDDRYSGTAALEVTPNGQFLLKNSQPIVIAEHPQQSEFRYLQFAVRGSGGGRAAFEINHQASAEQAARYDLGQGEPAYEDAVRVWEQPLPERWIVVTRDLYRDFGQVTMTGFTLSKLDGGAARFDHIYLARTVSHFEQTPDRLVDPLAILDVPIPPGPLFDEPERGIVLLHAGDRVATGVIVSEEGHIVTAAHLLAGPTKQLIAHFHDGTQEECQVVCYRRDYNIGMAKIAGRPRYRQYLKMADESLFGAKLDYLTFAFRFWAKPGDPPLPIHIPKDAPFAGRANVGNLQWELACGGPVLTPDLTIVGIHTGPDRRGGMGFLPIEYVRDNWEQLTTGAPGGDWGQYARPVLGVAYEAVPEGLKVTAIDPHWPAARSGIQVGDVITLADGKTVTPGSMGVYVLKHEPGDAMALTIRRAEKEDLQIAVVLGRRP